MIGLMIAAALAQAPAAPAPQWRSLGRVGQGEAFYDPASVQRNGATFDVRIRAVFDAVQTSGMRSGISLIRVDCAGRTVALRHVASFDDHGAPLLEGDATGPSSLPHAAPPNSPYQALLDQYCRR